MELNMSVFQLMEENIGVSTRVYAKYPNINFIQRSNE